VEADAIHLVVALGNPGPEHQFQRHNAGFMVGEELRRRHGFPRLRSRFKGIAGEGQVAGTRVLLLFPTTYMNLSGRAAAAAVKKHRISLERVLAIHDEVELPFGDARLKEGQGLGGHNGLRSLEQSLGARDFWRVRVGVGRPEREDDPLVDHVLAPFTEPREEVLRLIGQAADLVEEWLATRGR
jgi:PTH1 family peptidyl-tRNA hydrolase